MLSDLLDYFNIVDTIDIDPTDRFRIFANKGFLYGFELFFGQMGLIIIDQRQFRGFLGIRTGIDKRSGGQTCFGSRLFV